MKRHELEHVIRAAGAISAARELYVIGSQSILGLHPDAPSDLLVSQEVDLWPANNPGKADLIDGSIGEMSPFHETFGYFAHGVGPETATLPANWKQRVVPVANENTGGVTGLCLHPVDLAISKIAAGRQKDLEFVRTMIRFGLVTVSQIHGISDTECDAVIRVELDSRIRRLTDH